ncbi:MAG: hypothetical protein AAF085_03235 [Planctomycetota bacterium]
MPATDESLTLLIRPGEKHGSLSGLAKIQPVSDPGPSFPRLRKFFRPWRLVGKVLAVGVPCWIISVLAAVSGFAAGWLSQFLELIAPFANASMNAAAYFGLLPLGILALWAGFVAIGDALKHAKHRKQAKAYADAVSRKDEPDVLAPLDLRKPGVLEGLRALGSMEKLLITVDREGDRLSSLLRDSLYEAKRLLHRSVLDLIQTERRLAQWTERLGAESSYRAKLIARRDSIVGSYAGILDRCLEATDQALANATDDSAQLDRSVEQLLTSCQRALAQAEQDGPAIDEQELLMYAAKAREASESSASKADTPPSGAKELE